MFILEGLTVTIVPRFQAKIQRGELCPDLSSFELSFNITSDILGSGTGSFKFDIVPSADIERISIADDKSQSNVSPTGKLELTFSEPFINITSNLQQLKAK